MTRRRFARAAMAAALLVVAAGCAPKRIALPSGAGVPYPGFASAYEQATAECRAVDTMTASLALSGRAGSTRLRGRVDAGLASPDRIRLELFPPLAFGNPAVILVASGTDATLVLPRDNRVLQGEPAERIVEVLAGVPLGGTELRHVLAGCGLTTAAPGEGRSYPNGWIAADAGESTIYLSQIEGRWRVSGASRGTLAVQYSEFASGRPMKVSLRASSPSPADITLTLSDVEINMPLGDEVFQARVPADAVPLTLAELKRGMSQQ